MTGRRVLFMMVLVVASLILGLAVQAQDMQIALAPYEGNPVLSPNKALDWEAGGIGQIRLIADDGLYYMFYQCYKAGQTAGGIGYATSEDGLNWTRYEGNPVFVGDETLAPNGVMQYVVMHDGATWALYFVPWPEGKKWYELPSHVLVARAPAPGGPWAIDSEPVLTSGGSEDWDAGGIWLHTLARGADGYLLFYEGSHSQIGMATSADGVQWVKHDNPATTAVPYAASDPVLVANENPTAWDRIDVSAPVVRHIEGGWEMFYGAGWTGMTRSIGCATSPDGITWTRVGSAPLLSKGPGVVLSPEAVLEIEGRLLLYYAHRVGHDATTEVVDVALVEQ